MMKRILPCFFLFFDLFIAGVFCDYQCISTNVRAASGECTKPVTAQVCARSQTDADVVGGDLASQINGKTADVINARVSDWCTSARGAPKTNITAAYCDIIIYQPLQSCDNTLCNAPSNQQVYICCSYCRAVFDALCQNLKANPCVTGQNCIDGPAGCVGALEQDQTSVSTALLGGIMGACFVFFLLMCIAFAIFGVRRRARSVHVPLPTIHHAIPQIVSQHCHVGIPVATGTSPRRVVGSVVYVAGTTEAAKAALPVRSTIVLGSPVENHPHTPPNPDPVAQAQA